eukprot:CAMPEP_0177633974 /NCGR_PEP_ID=MMETSP0447-20121125/3126_1 /TAXON_ID=0 /ORGANISM="Stygamoeba regulata, Strain BSH-02190019" /LENGTH=110 /DNA_ID=CAMNT_0019135675 /DNA_START=264 /DNA_END=593 /DNA_ORIENTATION=-
MGGLTNDERQSVEGAAGSSVALAVVKPFLADSGSWIDPGVYGAAALVSEGASTFLRVVTIPNYEVVIEQELYENFDLHGHTSKFFTFEAMDSVIGLAFSDEYEAQSFCDN